MLAKMAYMILGVTWPLMFGALPLVVCSNNLVMFLMIKSSMLFMHIIANVLPIGSVNVCDNQEFYSTIHVELQSVRFTLRLEWGNSQNKRPRTRW
jgi:hypothetical protein